MVLHKRKQVNLLPIPQNIADNTEVWIVESTGEVLTDYEKYLKRYDWLNQKKFTDAVNGKSGLTYADAVTSENQSSADIEHVFPEVLRDPILRKVQFSQVSRMDDLVNWIYDEFKRDFFPGEEVFITIDDNETMQGLIREKAKFPMIRGPDGSVQRNAFSRYFIRLNHLPNEEALVDEKHLRRDRKVFTKLHLRAFLKKSLTREAWNGAPWLVNEHLAIQYRLPMEIPHNLMRNAELLNKAQAQPKPRQRRSTKNLTPDELARLQHQEQMQIQQQMQRQPGVPIPPHPTHPQAYVQHAPLPARPPPQVIKYPIEDIDVQPKNNGIARPPLEFFTDEMAAYVRDGRKVELAEVQMDSMGMLLEVWNTLNVQCEVYVLDSFTFDDFVDAMKYQQTTHVPCELLNEVFCAVLKQLVSDKGKIEVLLPSTKAEDEESEESNLDDSTVSTPVADVPARSTRSRLSHVENASEQPHSPTHPLKIHQAAEALTGFSWVDALAQREMEDGGWQLILAGILYQLSHAPQHKETCDKVLAHLLPLGTEVDTKDSVSSTIQSQFAEMDLNLRIAALQTITLLSVTTKALKYFMEACSEDQTDVRKRKMEFQRERKIAMENLAIKDRDRKIMLPGALPASPIQEVAAPAISDAMDTTENTITTNGRGSSEPEEDAASGHRSLRRSNNERKRKRDEENARKDAEEQKKKKALADEQDKKKQYQAMVRDCDLLRQQILDLEAKIGECDGDLREADVQRTKMLGKDRFCNRYYWFERNGQPFGGLPSSSTSGYGYANGRIWVQGPDDMEREGFIDLPKEGQAEYKSRFGVTVPERRHIEEGVTSLRNAYEWGFYDDPTHLDTLIGWLDDRGEREKKLRKELFDWRDKISTYMRARKNFMDNEAARKLEAEEEPKKGIATRRQTQEESLEAKERCLKWRNTMAQDQVKHLHCENPPKRKVVKTAAVSKAATGHVMVGRSGKPLTRQGK